jgi:hypothetical protein
MDLVASMDPVPDMDLVRIKTQFQIQIIRYKNRHQSKSIR